MGHRRPLEAAPAASPPPKLHSPLNDFQEMQVFSKVFALSERVTFQILKDFPERKRIFADGSLILGSNTLGLLGENSRLLVDEETLWLS